MEKQKTIDIKRLALTLTKKEYYIKNLNLISSVFPQQLSNKEIEVLAEFLCADKILMDGYMFNSQVRKNVRKKLGLSYGGLSNHITKMLEKGYLVKGQGTIHLNSALSIDEKAQGYQFKLICDENK